MLNQLMEYNYYICVSLIYAIGRIIYDNNNHSKPIYKI